MVAAALVEAFFDEPTNLARISCIGLVIVGIVGLQLQTKA